MQNVKMSTKIYCVMGLLVVIAVALSVTGIQRLAGMNQRLNGIVHGPAERVRLTGEINSDLLVVSRAERNIILCAGQQGGAGTGAPYRAELLEKPPVYIVPAVWGGKEPGDLDANQAEGNPPDLVLRA